MLCRSWFGTTGIAGRPWWILLRWLPMNDPTIRPQLDELRRMQLQKLNRLLAVAKSRTFYRDRLAGIELPLTSLDQLSAIPLLTKTDLIVAGTGAGKAERMGKAGACFDLPRQQYCRFHQTSGTRGYPMVVMDTAQDWDWWLDCWDHVLDAAAVTDGDTAMMAFSFGPFIGFWTAHDAMVRRGVLTIPGGGMSSEIRLSVLMDQACTVLCCTPTYALYLAGIAKQRSIDLRTSNVSRIIVAGEPGGSIASVRSRIEEAWDATVIDHAGGSEIGAWGFGSPDGLGQHVIESEFIAEILDVESGAAVPDGRTGELVLTNLGRHGGPAIRYRTGDIVRPFRNHDYASPFVWLQGGVIGRADDMVVVRGVNIFPSSIEAIIRQFDAQAEFRIQLSRHNEMDQIALEVEADDESACSIAAALQKRLTIRMDVSAVATGTLPRFDAKAKRVLDLR